MSYPAIATKTYEKLKDDPRFQSITLSLLKKLKRIFNPIRRAKYAHQLLDKYIEEVFENPVVPDLVQCKNKCSACCHTQVSVTWEEANLLATRVIKGTQIDLKSLKIQAEAGNDATKYYRNSYDQRKCVFLDSEGSCKVYDDRPMVCRSNYVLNDPKDCETKDGIEKPLRLLTTEKADMVIIGAYAYTKESGALPFMLWKALEEKSK